MNLQPTADKRRQAIDLLWDQLDNSRPSQPYVIPAVDCLGWRNEGETVGLFRAVPMTLDNPEDTYWMFVATYALLVLAAEGELI